VLEKRRAQAFGLADTSGAAMPEVAGGQRVTGPLQRKVLLKTKLGNLTPLI